MRLEPYVEPEKRVSMKDLARDAISKFVESGESAMTVIKDDGMTTMQCYAALNSVVNEFDGVAVRKNKEVISLHRRNQ